MTYAKQPKITHKTLGYMEIPPYLYGIRDGDITTQKTTKVMNMTKERLSEIEKELNGLTVKKLSVIANLTSIDKNNWKGFGEGQLVAGQTKFTCPYCNVSGKSYWFKGIHFDNCNFKGIDFTQLSSDIPIMVINDLVKKYNISRHLISSYAKRHNIPRKMERDHETGRRKRSTVKIK